MSNFTQTVLNSLVCIDILLIYLDYLYLFIYFDVSERERDLI